MVLALFGYSVSVTEVTEVTEVSNRTGENGRRKSIDKVRLCQNQQVVAVRCSGWSQTSIGKIVPEATDSGLIQ